MIIKNGQVFTQKCGFEEREVRISGSLFTDQKNPEEETEQKLFNQQLWQLIKELGEPDTSIIMRQYFYEQSTHEIAKALSMTAAAVQKRSIRARKRLKIILECKEYMRKDGCYEKLRQG